jgi:CBS domain containing-hemolysin-like protein
MTVLLITAALLLVNALFVSAEFAVIGTARSALEHKSNQGDRVARRLFG